MDLALRLLDPTDALAFQSLRLEGLLHHPASFRATYEEEAAQSLADVARRLAEQAVLGAFIDGELCGIAGFARPTQAKKRHKGELWGVYVRPGTRREGLGSALVEAVIEHARGRVAQLCATVALTNRPARRLYRKLGFEPYGLEPRGLRVGERYLDQEHLVLLLDADAARSGLGSTGALALCHDLVQADAPSRLKR
jgi:ribosomal protein S18 acetylase RimI-like enzyme